MKAPYNTKFKIGNYFIARWNNGGLFVGKMVNRGGFIVLFGASK